MICDQRPTSEAVAHKLKFRADCSFEDAKELIKRVLVTAVVFGSLAD